MFTLEKSGKSKRLVLPLFCLSLVIEIYLHTVLATLDSCQLLYIQLKDRLNSNGDNLVFVLKNLLNDCGCSKPSA